MFYFNVFSSVDTKIQHYSFYGVSRLAYTSKVYKYTVVHKYNAKVLKISI